MAKGGHQIPKTSHYLKLIGVPELPPRTSPFDPGYDPLTLERQLEQSAHLIPTLTISMASWQIAKEVSTRRKVAAANRLKILTRTGAGPFEIAATFGSKPS